MKRFKHQSAFSLSLTILFTFFPFLSTYDYHYITLCDAEIFIRVTDDVTPFDSCENFAHHLAKHFHRVASELYISSNNRLALTKFIVDVPSSWKYSCYHEGTVNECRRHHILLTDQDLQPFIHTNFKCDNYGKHSSLVISYQQLSGDDLPDQVWRALEYRYFHQTNNDVDICKFKAIGPEQKLSDQDECPAGFRPTVQLSSYQYYNESLMTLDIKSQNDKNVYMLTLKPKLNGHWLDNIKVSATIKLGTRASIIHADKQGNGNFGMTIRNLFGPGTYEVSFNVQGTDARWYPDEADGHAAEQHCVSDYRDPKFVQVGTFNWDYPRTEEYTFAPDNQPVLKTQSPVNVELTTPKRTDEETSNDPLVLYIVVPIVVLAVVFILLSIYYYGKNEFKSKKGYDEDFEEGGGSENEDDNK